MSRAVLITGCSSGIGKATALRLARGGWPVYATARKVEALEELSVAGCQTLALDVCDEGSMRAAVARVESDHGAVGALVNNAGYSQTGAVEAVPMARVRAQFETNVFGLVALTQLVLPAMRKARAGRIVNVSSMGGKLVFPGGGFYHATKHAVEALSDALRFEVKGFGVQVVVIEPGLIRSGFAEAALGEMAVSPEVAEAYRGFHEAVARTNTEVYEKGPLASLAGTPDDVAAVIEKALTATRPKTRYTVTGSATFLLTTKSLLTDRAWDAFVGNSYPAPG
jgi:NAD(P)-dependent dehydrogenase (short-subunit alcohol dehydrogenase family)